MTAAFAAALLDPAAPVPEGLVDPAGRPAGRRFAVYRNNVAVGLTEALEVGFPVVRKLVGAEFFRAMAAVHLRAHPPKSRVMADYGQDMPLFLQGFPPVSGLPYLPDVARLELALRRAYHAADASPLPPDALSSAEPRQLLSARLRLAPAVALVRSDWPVHGIWAANMADGPAPVPGPEDVLVVRPGFDPVPHLLPAGGAAFVDALLEGRTMGEAAEFAGPSHDLTATVGLLLAGGAITGILEHAA